MEILVEKEGRGGGGLSFAGSFAATAKAMAAVGITARTGNGLLRLERLEGRWED